MNLALHFTNVSLYWILLLPLIWLFIFMNLFHVLHWVFYLNLPLIGLSFLMDIFHVLLCFYLNGCLDQPTYDFNPNNFTYFNTFWWLYLFMDRNFVIQVTFLQFSDQTHWYWTHSDGFIFLWTKNLCLWSWFIKLIDTELMLL